VPDVRRRRVEAEVITGDQIRAARKLLGWTRAELAVRAFGVSSHTIESAERERTRVPPTDAQLASIRRALESAGVEFTNGDEPGVKLRRLPTAPAKPPS
jgi:transcriptional regulator with XRE-family HTH domain